MSGTEWFCGVQLGGVKLPAEFPAARNSKSMVHAGTGRWRQKNGRPMLIVGSRLAVYRMAVFICCSGCIGPMLSLRSVLCNSPLSRRLGRCDCIIQNQSRDPNGGNVYYVTMQITLLNGKFRNVERNLHCDVVHITTVWVSSLALDCNVVFAIKDYVLRFACCCTFTWECLKNVERWHDHRFPAHKLSRRERFLRSPSTA